MRIVADRNMPLLDEFFGDLGDIVRVDGRGLRAADVAGADMLLVRSVTRVDATLLAGAQPRFVGTATIGTDHVDTALLAARGIPFASAPGCNAVAVAEWLCTVLALDAEAGGPPLAGRTVGVVGCGNVGRAVVGRLLALGCRVCVCDPLLAAADLPADIATVSLEALLEQCDTVTLHVPLTSDGPAPTWHLLDATRLARSRCRLLVNSARGPVVDNVALAEWLANRGARRAVLDVWETEPSVPPALLARAWLGSPHVAGYSAEGKWRGTAMLRAACARVLGVPAGVTLHEVLRRRGDVPAVLRWQGSLGETLAAVCDVRGDDQRLRAVVAEGPAAFDRLRRDYAERREFAHFRVSETPKAARGPLSMLGFSLED